MSTLPTATTDRSDADAIIAITQAAEAGKLRTLGAGARYSVVIPDGYRHQTIDMSHLLTHPERAKGQVHLQTVDDFAAYVERHYDPAMSTVWVDADSGFIAAVLDDHAGPAREGDVSHNEAFPGWGEHRALLRLRPTEEWEHWLRHNGDTMSQEAFAEHIEDGLADIVTPSGAEMLEIAQTLQGATKADWKSAKRLSDGQVQLVYVEETTATAGGDGQLQIPAEFTLGIPTYLGEPVDSVRARLRYRVNGGKVMLGYKLDRPEIVRRHAIDAIADRLSQRFAGRVFIGTPRS